MTNKAQITFIAPAHNEGKHQRPLVESLLSQTDNNWSLIVFHNGPNEEMKEWVESYKDTRIVYEESDMDTGQWGTINRQTAISFMADTPYIINTSIQDYYLPHVVQELNNLLVFGADLVTWQAINHLFRYSILSGEIAFGHIDWGQWCIKTDIIKQVGIQKGEEFASDFYTLQAIAQSGLLKNVHKIDKVLNLHL